MADAFKDSFNQFANKKQEILTKLADTHEERIINTLKNLEDEIIADLTSITDGGAKLNTRLAMELRPNLKRLIQENFLKEADSIVSEYDEIVKEYQRFNQRLPIPSQFKTLTKPDLKVINDLKMLSYSGFEDVGNRFLDTISNEVYQSSVTGRPFNQMVKNIRGQINGVYQRSNETAINRLTGYIDKNRYSDNAQIIAKVKNAREILHTKYASDILGNNMRRYAGQIAQDSLMQFDGQFTLYKGKEAGITKYQYVGTNITTTRDFCRRYLNRVFTEEEAREIWQGSWRGKSGTDPFVNRGGYRCRHSFILYDDDWFTEETDDNIQEQTKVNQKIRKDQNIFKKTGEEAKLLDSAYESIKNDKTNPIVKAITFLPTLKRLIKDSKDGSYYRRIDDKIVIEEMLDPIRFDSTFRHEYGHRIDDNILRLLKENKRKNLFKKLKSIGGITDEMFEKLPSGQTLSSYAGRKVLNDRNNLKKNTKKNLTLRFNLLNDVPPNVNEFDNYLTKVLKANPDFPLSKKEMNTLFSRFGDFDKRKMLNLISKTEFSSNNVYHLDAFFDYIGAVTNNKLGYGHKLSYYRKFNTHTKGFGMAVTEGHTSEIFANFIELSTNPKYGQIYIKLMRYYAPETTQMMEQIIQEIGVIL